MGHYHNPQVSVLDNLAFYYDAANLRSYPGSGSVWSDLSNYASSGSMSGTAFSDVSGISSIWFNATTSSVNVGTNGQNVTTQWSIEAWIRPSGYGENNTGRIYQHSSGSLTGFIYSIDNSGTTAGLSLNTYAVSGFTVRYPNIVDLNVWQQHVITFSSGTVTWYKNGAALGTSSTTSPSAFNSDSYIGNSSAGDRTFDGNISVVKMYRNILSANEIKKNFNALKSRFGLS